MPSPLTTLRVAAPLAVASALLATGCTSHTSPGAAAIVGTQTISEATLQSYVNDAASYSGLNAQLKSDRAALTRQTLSTLILDRLVTDLAKKYGVTASAADVQSTTTSLVQQDGGIVQLQQAAGAEGVPPNRLTSEITVLTLEHDITEAIANSFTVPQSDLQAQYDKDVKAGEIPKTTTLEQATGLLKAEILGQQLLQSRLVSALMAQSKSEQVHVNPRYGVWNASTAQVDAPKSTLSSPAPGEATPSGSS